MRWVSCCCAFICAQHAGYQVRYLGQDLPQDDLIAEAMAYKPALILFSASGVDAAANLQQLCERLVTIDPPRPIIGYGGRVFNVHPELRNGMAGVFAENNRRRVVESVGDMLTERPRQNGWSA